MSEPVWVTGTAAFSAAGGDPESIRERLRSGESAIGPIRQWDASRSPVGRAGEIAALDRRRLVSDRKVHKYLRRTDFLGLGAAAGAVERAGLEASRERLGPDGAAAFDEETAIFVGSGGSAYSDQYDFLPLLALARDDPAAFGRELASTVTPLWLLRSLPNNVLCHAGIRFGFKGPNSCFTSHSASGALAHDAPIEPERIRGYDALGLLSREMIRPFDRRHDGSLLGEGAGALVLESSASLAARGVRPIAAFLGGAVDSEAEGVIGLRDDGEGLAHALRLALERSGIAEDDVSLIVAHGNGTPRSDDSEARALREVFGGGGPPVTAFKWAFGHTLAASMLLESVVAIESLRRGEAPGIATLSGPAPAAEGLPLAREAVTLGTGASSRGAPVALVLGRGFAATNAALVFRLPRGDEGP